MNKKRFLIAALLIILVVVLAVWLLPSLQSQQTEVCRVPKNNPDTLFGIDYETDALPITSDGYASQLISHSAYKLSYNKDYKVPNWVFYELLREELEGNNPRKDNFRSDPLVAVDESATLSDYRNSGYDRGHIAPAADFSWDATAKDESFYLSNMCPQTPSFNRGIWKRLEDQVRAWAYRDSAVCVVAGPVLPDTLCGEFRSIGSGQVFVPELFYKVVFSVFAEKPRMIAFVMPNEKSNADLQMFVVSVDSVERLTQLDFFPILPDSIENVLESSVDINDWF